jgi:hypothetical protein
MEALQLSKPRLGEQYAWIGRDCRAVEDIVDWSRYEETPSGWQLKPRPTRPLSEERLRWEIDHVLKELDEFQNYLLPEMSARDPRIFAAQHDSATPRWMDRVRSLGEWQAAIRSLRGILANEATALPRALNLTWFRQFMWAEPKIDYAIENEKIRWQIACFGSLDWAQLVNWTVLPDECRPRNSEDTARSVEAMKRWLRTGSPHNLTTSCFGIAS